MRRSLTFFLLIVLFHQPMYANIRFLSISDIHYGENSQSRDGEDTGPILLQSALKEFHTLSHQVDFVMILGDLPIHHLVTNKTKIAYLTKIFHELYVANDEHKPMFFVAGNNDSLEANYGAFLWQGQSPLTYAKNWQGACANCDGLMIDKKYMASHGVYATYVMPHQKDIILVVLNGNQFSKRHPLFQTKAREQQAKMILQWLDNLLKTHRAKQLLLATHIPPGVDYRQRLLWESAYMKQFVHILDSNQKNYQQITLLTSHTHMDDLRRIKFNNHTYYAFATPGISRIHNNNPAMKIFELNKQFLLGNYTTYYTTNPAIWEHLKYSAKEGKNPVFRQCHQDNLSDCLDKLSDKDVCDTLHKGDFYGAKAHTVDGSTCTYTYPINW